MVKIIIIAVAALVVATGGTVGVMMMLAPKAEVAEQTAETSPAEGHATADSNATHSSDTSSELASADSALAAAGLTPNDMSSIDNIIANLQQLPDPQQETASSHAGSQISPEDSAKLQEQRLALVKREKELEDWQKKLEKREADVNRKLIVIEQAQSNRIASLAKLYDNMDPSAAAQVISGIDDETIIQVLPRMKTQNAAAILGQLPPQRAALLSKKMISLAEDGH